jgi:uncharacterized protein YneR
MEKEFKKELKTLLKKYNANISFYVSDDSDTWALYDEKLMVEFNNNNKDIALVDGWVLSHTDL